MKTCIIVQCRVGSKRLKKKNLLKLSKDGLTLIEVVILRLKQSKMADQIILATSTKKKMILLSKLQKNMT